jgi:hypothetical protein
MKQEHCKSKRQSYEKKRLYLVIRRRMAEKKGICNEMDSITRFAGHVAGLGKSSFPACRD